MNWNGIDELSAEQVLELNSTDAARWWRECCDPAGLGCPVRGLPELARVFGLPRGIGTRALRYARDCANG